MLPFTEYGEIQNQGGDTLAEDVPLRLEFAGNSQTRIGEAYDWTADVHLIAGEHLLGETNRRFVVDSRNYKVVSAELHDFIPHLSVNLKEVRGG